MKKIKLISAMATISAVSPALLVLTQCNKGDRTPTIDPSVSEEVNISIKMNTDGSATCTLTPKKVSKKIKSVTVKIGSNTLVEGDDYATNINSTNSVDVTIYKTAIDKYQGNIVITPVLETRTMNGFSATLKKTSFVKSTKFTKRDVVFNETYDGDIGEVIDPTDSHISVIYLSTDVTESFKGDGFDVGATTGTFALEFKYDGKYTQAKTINVINQTFTITCTICSDADFATISKSTIQVEEGKTWGEIKPDITIGRDVDEDTVELYWTYSNGSKRGNHVYDTDVITESCNIELDSIISGSALVKAPLACDTLGSKSTYGYDCYIPSSKTVDVKSEEIYKFKIDLDAIASGKKFKYFWIVLPSETRLLSLYNISVQSVKYNDEWVQYEVTNDSRYGRYVTFAKTYTTGTIEIEFRPLSKEAISIIPCFEAD